jgi:hypothetical protein
MLDIKPGDVRSKKSQARVVIGFDKGNAKYLAIDAKDCWQTTWASWGKKADTVLLELDGRFFSVVVTEVTADLSTEHVAADGGSVK